MSSGFRTTSTYATRFSGILSLSDRFLDFSSYISSLESVFDMSKVLNKVPLKERTLAISVLLFLSGVSYKKGSHKSDTPCGILGSCGFGWYGRDGDMRIGDKKLADIAK